MTKARDLANGGFGLILMKPSSVVNGTDNGKGTVSFSGASSVSINNVFNSTYRNYQLVFNGTITTGTDVQFRLRKSGSDATGANYYFNEITMISNSSTVSGGNSDGNTLFRIAKGTNTVENIGAITNVLAPQDSGKRTIMDSTYSFYNNTRGEQGRLQCVHNVLDSYDGFTLIASAGSIAGTISIYGYNN